MASGGGASRLLLPAMIAVGSYVPFELLAKATLIIAAVCFITNPFQYARIVAVGLVRCLIFL